MSHIRVGVSGWSYDHWRRGAFYPDDLPRRRELEYVTRRFDSVEINSSFYSLLRPATYARYRETAPEGFHFAVKGSRFITHAKKLRDIQTPLANFFASGVLRLEEKLGPILWQLPSAVWEVARIERFLDLLPRDTDEASALARRHDERVMGRASVVAHGMRRMRHALEVRSEGLLTGEVARACRDRNVALVFSDSGDWPYVEELTAGWAYLRLHGSPETYASRYGDRRLETWARRIRAWSGGGEPEDAVRITERPPPRRKTRDVYVYFDNDGSAHAPADACSLMERLAAGP